MEAPGLLPDGQELLGVAPCHLLLAEAELLRAVLETGVQVEEVEGPAVLDGIDAQLVEELAEVGVGGTVEDDEGRVDAEDLPVLLDLDGVGVPAEAVLPLEDGDPARSRR